MSGKTILVWFRNDLRIHDNEILIEAVRKADQVIPVYCFDPRYFTDTRYGTKKTGLLRAQFLLESVSALRDSLKQLGGDLIIRVGKPEDVLPEICSSFNVSEVYHHREVASTETSISALVEEVLWKKQINLKHFIGHTLYHKEDLPFPIKNIPNDFATFRKKIERDSVVRPCFDTPDSIRIPPDLESGDVPLLEELGYRDTGQDDISVAFRGGEQEGLRRLTILLEEDEPRVKGSKALLNSRLSPWLSIGCLSSREVYWAVKKNRPAKSAQDLGSRVILELQWRDFFRFMLKKHGTSMLAESEGERDLSSLERKQFQKWLQGETGNVLVDACMNELNATGYVHEKVKYFLSSFLVEDLKVLWRAGAAYLEEKAIDYSPASDWGNWAYLVGGEIMASNQPLRVKPEEISEDLNIKKWLLEQSSFN